MAAQKGDGLAILGILLATNLRETDHKHLGKPLQCAERVSGFYRCVLFDVTHQEDATAMLLSDDT